LWLQVLEYSELDPATASAVNPATGKLYYNWSNICMHYFALPWLTAAAAHLRTAAVYHIAHKQIPSKGGKVPGLKLEMFIFDPFHTANKVTLYEVGAGFVWCLCGREQAKEAPGLHCKQSDSCGQLRSAEAATWRWQMTVGCCI
jgi:hypothetical protein